MPTGIGFFRKPSDSSCASITIDRSTTAATSAGIKLDTEKEGGANLKFIKDQVRSIPNKGMTYGVLKYLSEDEDRTSQIELFASIIFNYLGVENYLVSETLGTGKKFSLPFNFN